MQTLSQKDAFDQLVAQGTVLIEFYADWCPDCRFIEPALPEIEAKYSDRLTLVRVNTDQFPQLAQQYNILGIPSFLLFQSGEVIGRFVSKLRKTKEEVENFLDQTLSAHPVS